MAPYLVLAKQLTPITNFRFQQLFSHFCQALEQLLQFGIILNDLQLPERLHVTGKADYRKS